MYAPPQSQRTISLILYVCNVNLDLLLQVKHAVQLDIPVHKATNIMLVLGMSSMVSRIIFGRICDSEKINRLYFNQASVFFVGMFLTS